MTVAELIKVLDEYDPNAKVYIWRQGNIPQESSFDELDEDDIDYNLYKSRIEIS